MQLWQLRCECQCRTRGSLDDDEAAISLRTFENTVRALEEQLESDGRLSDRRSSSPSSPGVDQQMDEPLPKMSSNPEMSVRTIQTQESVIRPTLRKTHKKTISNVSRVSFNMDLTRRDSDAASIRDWTLDRKTTLLNRRNSSLLSSKRPSLTPPDGAIIDALGAENLLLRGARLKNTSYVYGKKMDLNSWQGKRAKK